MTYPTRLVDEGLLLLPVCVQQQIEMKKKGKSNPFWGRVCFCVDSTN